MNEDAMAVEEPREDVALQHEAHDHDVQPRARADGGAQDGHGDATAAGEPSQGAAKGEGHEAHRGNEGGVARRVSRRLAAHGPAPSDAPRDLSVPGHATEPEAEGQSREGVTNGKRHQARQGNTRAARTGEGPPQQSMASGRGAARRVELGTRRRPSRPPSARLGSPRDLEPTGAMLRPLLCSRLPPLASAGADLHHGARPVREQRPQG